MGRPEKKKKKKGAAARPKKNPVGADTLRQNRHSPSSLTITCDDDDLDLGSFFAWATAHEEASPAQAACDDWDLGSFFAWACVVE